MTLFDMKRVAFENAVRRCAKALGLDYSPGVSITETPCPLYSGETAHIHVEDRIICIWKKRLEELTLDEIDKVAAHEVAHLVSIGHNGRHAQAQAELEIASWNRSAGGVVIHGGKEVAPIAPSEHIKPRRREKICSYYSCEKRTKLRSCTHCGRLFCEEHLKPKPPSLPPFKQRGVLGRIYMEEWRETGGHPCPPYYDYLKIKKKEELERIWEAMNRMRGIPLKKPIDIVFEPEEKYKPEKRSGPKPHAEIIAVVVTVVALVILVTWVLLSA